MSSERPNDSDSSKSGSGLDLKWITAVIALMLSVFALLQVVLTPGPMQSIAPIIAGLILTLGLIQSRKLQWGMAFQIWAAISICLIVVYQVVSQPVTVIGYVIKPNDTPLSGLTLMLTNSHGGQQIAVSDEHGQFQINGVPEGKYTITANGKFVTAGTIPQGWQRIFQPVFPIGTYPEPGASQPTAVVSNPTVTPTVSPTELPNSTTVPTSSSPVPVPTLITNTPLPTPQPTSTSTPLLTSTPVPPRPYLGVMFQEDFEGGNASSLTVVNPTAWQIKKEDSGNTIYCVEATTWQEFIFGSASWKDYNLQYRLKVIDYSAGDDRGIIAGLRRQAGFQGYNLGINLGSARAWIERSELSREWLHLTDSALTPPIALNTWHVVRAEASDGSLRLFVDDNLNVAVWDTNYTYGMSSIMVQPQTSICIDDIVVRNLDRSPQALELATRGYIKAGSDNVPAFVEPDETSQRIMQLSTDAEVFIIQWNSDKSWALIRYDPQWDNGYRGFQGWMRANYIELVSQ